MNATAFTPIATTRVLEQLFAASKGQSVVGIGLRPFRILDDEYRYYGTWDLGQALSVALRDLAAKGMIVNESSDFGLDLIGASGDLLETFTITKAGMAYVRRQLPRARIERPRRYRPRMGATA